MSAAKLLPNIGLVVASVLVATAIAEGATRLLDGFPVLTDYLPNTLHRDATSDELDSIPRAPGVSRNWFFRDPPPLPNRTKPPAEWERIATAIPQNPNWVGMVFRPAEFFKAWNAEYARDPCALQVLRQAPGRLFLSPSIDGSQYPRFRFLPNATTPLGLVTNALGWRGPPVEFTKPAKVVRIVFVGASTTVNSHHYPFSYPELIGKWLDLWAESRGLGVRFEALNAGREGMNSTDIEAIVRTEVLPLRPDLVVYYEGANQFTAREMVKEMVPQQSANPEPEDTQREFRHLMGDLAYRSALVRRLKLALDSIDTPRAGAEWPKPEYELIWPPNLDEADPDLTRQDLPVQLPIILRDLDRIRANVTAAGAELALSSFKWFVHDGLVLDPVRHRTLLGHLNIAMYPLRYRDIARVAALQNRVYAKYAAIQGLPFFDVANLMPPSKDLYTDAVHFSYAGIRLHAWIVMQGLVPLIEKRLSAGVWPRPAGPSAEPPPGLYYTPTAIPVSCNG